MVWRNSVAGIAWLKGRNSPLWNSHPKKFLSPIGKDRLINFKRREREAVLSKIVVSNSEVQTFKQCKRSWYLRYVRKLVPAVERPVSPAALGTRFHGALAKYYVPGVFDPDAAFEYHEKVLQRDLINFSDQEKEIRAQAKLSQAMLEGYFEWLEETGVDEGLTVVAPERIVQVELPNAILQGKLDLLVERERDGAILVLDHKSVQNFSDPVSLLPLNEQVRTYILLKMLDEPDKRIDGALWNMARKVLRTGTAKPPFFMREEIRFNKAEMRHFYLRVIAEIEAILELHEKLDNAPDMADVIAYPSPGRDCKWRCDFFGICALIDTDLTAGGLTETLYKQGDPYSYYNDMEADGIN